MKIESRVHIYCTRNLRNMILTCCFSFILIKLTASIEDDTSSRSHSALTSVMCPSSCYCDDNGEYVSCVGDGLWRFPMEIPNTTVRLELRNYLINELTTDDLISLTEIEELKLQQSHIQKLENGTFSSNVKLERLDLSQNILASLSSFAFNNLINLRYLDLSTNLLEEIEEAFAGLVNLEQLNLRDNKLQQLSTNTFLGLHKVQYLNLDANNISTIEVGTFQYLTNLAHLIISNNPLTSLSRLDFFGSRLQYIDISHVGLDRIPQSLTKFVRDLRLAKNNLTHISAGDFDSYPYLGLLVLDDNCVSEIENDALGRQEYLMRLWLNGNCLTKVPPNLPPSLLALYMEENKLTELSSYSFKGLIHLEQLFLQRNEIKYMTSCVFCDLVSLKSLDLQANQIENLTSGIFTNLTQLQTLDLSQNNLKYIDSRCFESLSHLTTLQMSRVHTPVELSEAIFDPLHNLQTLEVYDSSILVHTIINSTRMLHGLRKVQELNIMHNRIVKLRSDFPSFFPSLKIIKLSGNLWHCDENIKWLSNWIKQSNVQFYSSYNIRCASPQSILFKPLMMLTDNDFETTTVEVTTVSTTESLADSNLLTSPLTTEEVTSIYHTTLSAFATTNSGRSEFISTASSVVTENLNETESAHEIKSVPSHPYQYNIVNNDQKTKHKAYTSAYTSTEQSWKVTSKSSTKSSKYISAKSAFINTQYVTTINSLTSEISEKDSETQTISKSQYNAADEIPLHVTNPQTVSPQRRVLSSRLRIVPQNKDSNSWDKKTMIIVSATVAGACVLFVIGALTTFTCLRLRHRYQPVKHRNMRRSSSISYYPQKDEVSIVTLTEGTVGLRTTSHHGLGNKLYYIMENGGSTTDPSTEALPDSQLQELLPHSTVDSTHVY